MTQTSTRPHRLPANKIPLFYAGGDRIDRFRREPASPGPEDWVGSVTAIPPALLPPGADPGLGISPLPKSLHDAIGIAEDSELLAEALGEHVFDFFLRNKRSEWEEYRTQVSAYERDRMLPVL